MLKTPSRKIQLPNVTLVAVSSVKIEETIRALQYSMEGVDFGTVLFITHEKPKNLPETITFKECKPLRSIEEYNEFMYYNLVSYISTEFIFHIHHDGYILRPKKWQDAFLKYDYIGAPWPKKTHFTPEGEEVRVGNGACAIKSRKLMSALLDLKLPLTDNGTGDFNEDINTCVYHRKTLENHGLRFAPVALASAFSRETDCDDSAAEPFGFHKHMDLRPVMFLIKHFLFKDAVKRIAKPILKPLITKIRSIPIGLRR